MVAHARLSRLPLMPPVMPISSGPHPRPVKTGQILNNLCGKPAHSLQVTDYLLNAGLLKALHNTVTSNLHPRAQAGAENTAQVPRCPPRRLSPIGASPKSIRTTGTRYLAPGESPWQGIYSVSKMFIPSSDVGNV